MERQGPCARMKLSMARWYTRAPLASKYVSQSAPPTFSFHFESNRFGRTSVTLARVCAPTGSKHMSSPPEPATWMVGAPRWMLGAPRWMVGTP
eukprot:4045821-Pyramimonas_sp.AAC.1